jgi:hypothetical protein
VFVTLCPLHQGMLGTEAGGSEEHRDQQEL